MEVHGRTRIFAVSLLNRLVGFGRARASARSRRVLCCCGRRGSGGSARSHRLVMAFSASLHIIRLNVFSWDAADADNVWRHSAAG